jgi:hypothetical protein
MGWTRVQGDLWGGVEVDGAGWGGGGRREGEGKEGVGWELCSKFAPLVK